MKPSIMKPFFRAHRWLLAVAVGGTLLLPLTSLAFPPAPYHTIFGLVRDEFGVPLSLQNAQIVFEPTNGVQIVGIIVPNLEPGVNYRLRIPMDSGIKPDLYKSTALKPTVGFRIQVIIGSTVYLPMEMVGDYANLGEPAQSTRIDLTLGVDADGDGLPDAWQQLILAMLGPDALVGPHDDPDGDGIINQQEYYSGTLPWVRDGGLHVGILPQVGTQPLLEFTVMSPHTYTVLGSTNLQTWAPLPFTIPTNGPSDPARTTYTATGPLQVLQVEPQFPATPPPSQYFKILVE